MQIAAWGAPPAPHQGRKGRNQNNHREGDSQPGQGQMTHLRDPAHIDPVHHIIKKVHKLGKYCGDRQLCHNFPNGAVAILLLSCTLLSIVSFHHRFP